MKYLLFTIILLMSISTQVVGQDYDKQVIRSAKMMTSALEKQDFDEAIKYIHKNVIAMAGGADSMKSIMKEAAEIKNNDGYEILQTVTIGPGSYIEAGEEIHTIVAQEQIFRLSDNKFKTDVYLLGVSEDNGDTWTFVNLEAYNQENIKIFFPNFNEMLRLPAPPRAELLK